MAGRRAAAAAAGHHRKVMAAAAAAAAGIDDQMKPKMLRTMHMLTNPNKNELQTNQLY